MMTGDHSEGGSWTYGESDEEEGDGSDEPSDPRPPDVDLPGAGVVR